MASIDLSPEVMGLYDCAGWDSVTEVCVRHKRASPLLYSSAIGEKLQCGSFELKWLEVIKC